MFKALCRHTASCLLCKYLWVQERILGRWQNTEDQESLPGEKLDSKLVNFTQYAASFGLEISFHLISIYPPDPYSSFMDQLRRFFLQAVLPGNVSIDWLSLCFHVNQKYPYILYLMHNILFKIFWIFYATVSSKEAWKFFFFFSNFVLSTMPNP